MAEQTTIEWCDSTFNPWIGCTRVSPACDDCYAARSTPARTLGVVWGAGQERHRTSAANWKQVETWQRQAGEFQAQHGRRRRVFCASLADWLDNEVLDTQLADLLDLIRRTPDLQWLLLSKRIGNWQQRLTGALAWAAIESGRRIWPGLAEWIADWLDGKAPQQVWLGATVVDQIEANRDVPKLLRWPATVRFLSIEPMLGPVDLSHLDVSLPAPPTMTAINRGVELDALRGRSITDLGIEFQHKRRIDWVIAGGESGPKARPMHPDWARSLRDRCAAAGVPYLFKQWGEWLPPYAAGTPEGFLQYGHGDLPVTACGNAMMTRIGKKAAGRQLDGRTHDGFPT